MKPKVLRLLLLFLFFSAFFSTLLYSDSLYTSSINVSKILENMAEITWKGNKQFATFAVYRSKEGPVYNSDQLDSAKLVAVVETSGSPDGSLYEYAAYYDTLTAGGDYYYAVLPYQTAYSDSDFAAYINYTIEAVSFDLGDESVEVNEDEEGINYVFEEEEDESELKTRSLFAYTSDDSVVLFWNLNRTPDEDLIFYIYRGTSPFTDYEQLKNAKIYEKLFNEYIYEDYKVESGMSYYYAVVLNTETNLVSGENTLSDPVNIGEVDYTLTYEFEYLTNLITVKPYTDIPFSVEIQNEDEINTNSSWNFLQPVRLSDDGEAFSMLEYYAEQEILAEAAAEAERLALEAAEASNIIVPVRFETNTNSYGQIQIVEIPNGLFADIEETNTNTVHFTNDFDINLLREQTNTNEIKEISNTLLFTNTNTFRTNEIRTNTVRTNDIRNPETNRPNWPVTNTFTPVMTNFVTNYQNLVYTVTNFIREYNLHEDLTLLDLYVISNYVEEGFLDLEVLQVDIVEEIQHYDVQEVQVSEVSNYRIVNVVVEQNILEEHNILEENKIENLIFEMGANPFLSESYIDYSPQPSTVTTTTSTTVRPVSTNVHFVSIDGISAPEENVQIEPTNRTNVVPETTEIPRNSDTNRDAETLQNAQALFDNKKYLAASALLEGLSTTEAKMLLGKCYYFTGDYEDALSIFLSLKSVNASAELWVRLSLNRIGD